MSAARGPTAAPLARIECWNDVPRAISQMQLAGAGHRVPLLQALYRGEISHLEVQREGSSRNFKQWAAAIRLPGVALIGDDAETKPDGPQAWPIAPRALRWARFVLIHGGAGDPAHYHYAILLAQQFRRLLMIECASANIQAWQAAAERWAGGEGQVVMPPPGVLHPARCGTGDLH